MYHIIFKDKRLLILIGVFLISAFTFYNFQNKEATAGSEHNVSGWAWSENIGWTSFNSINQGIGANYGVSVDSGGNISGYAWSENIGWISFNSSDISGCPSAPCAPILNRTTSEVSGWAKALATGGGWDGWIHLRGSNYGVIVSACAWDGWAWGSDVIGWIHFKGANYGVGESGSACANQIPSATSLLASQPDYCVSGLAGFFSWTFTDSDAGDSQSAYRIQIDNDSSFSFPEGDSGKINSDSQSYATTSLSYDTTYYWQLKVWDSKGAESPWIEYNDPSDPDGDGNSRTFTTPKHAYPRPNFTHSPQKPEIGQEVLFTDTSKCYSAPDNTEYECKTERDEKIQYQWDFDYVIPSFNVNSNDKGNTTTTYSQPKNYTVGLRIRDHSLSPPAVCIGTGDSPVVAILPLPIWREIPPF